MDVQQLTADVAGVSTACTSNAPASNLVLPRGRPGVQDPCRRAAAEVALRRRRRRRRPEREQS